jgi:signal transduction histidine kinase
MSAEQLGRWRLLRPLGRGSFGSVWQAEDAWGHLAAVKLLEAPPGEEALALSRVCHPAIPTVLDAGGGGRPFLAMSLAEGRPLSAMIRAGRAPEEAATAITGVLADALAEVHAAGIIHGDIKPANVVVGSVRQQQVSLVDFGMVGNSNGGTFNYAAPERLAGQPQSAPADVYALGLLCWEMLYGGLPWAEDGVSVSLTRRRHETPTPPSGSPWLVALLRRILDPSPDRRPTAADVADALSAHGVVLPPITPALIRRRASAVHVPRPELTPLLESWLEDGGCLAIHGARGSGRSHLIGRLLTRLQAAGEYWVRMVASDRAWAPIENILNDPALPGEVRALPDLVDPEERAERSARLIEERAPTGLAVLVDEFDLLDEGSRLVLAALARRGAVRICVTGGEPPAWATTSASLEPLRTGELRELIRQILGASVPLDLLTRLLEEASGGSPRIAVDLLARSTSTGALVRRARRWLVDERAFSNLTLSSEADTTIRLTGEAAWLGGLLAAARRPLPQDQIPEISGRSQEGTWTATAKLVELGLARVEHGRVSCAGLSAQQILQQSSPDPARICRRLLKARLKESIPDDPLIGWYIIGAADRELAEKLGVSAILSTRRRDTTAAARQAEALWALAETPALAAARIDSLQISGLRQEAVAFGESLPESLCTGEVLLARARAWLAVEDGEAATREILKRARAVLDHGRFTLALALLEARLCAREGSHEDAVRLAQPGCAVSPPTDGAGLDEWLELHGVCAQSLHSLGRLHEALELLAEVPTGLGQGRTARAMLDGIHARLLWHAGRFLEAARALERAGAEGSGLAALDRARMLNNSGLVFYQTGARLEALVCWEESLLLFERLDGEVDRIRVSNNLCVGYREVGRWERARQAGDWAVVAARRRGVVELEAMAAGNMGDLYLEQGAFSDALLWFERAGAIAEAHDLTGELVELARRQATLAVASGDPLAESLARAGLKRAEEAEVRVEVSRCRALLAVCLAGQGEAEETERLLHRAIEDLREDGAAGELALIRLLAAQAWHALTWSRRALLDCERVIAYAGELGLVPLRDRAHALRERISEGMEPAADRRRLEVLMNLAVRVASEQDEQALLDAIAISARELLSGDRSYVILQEGETFRIAARCGEGSPSRSVVMRVFTGRREVIAADLSERSDLRQAQSVMAMNLRSAMCVPLIVQGEILGAVYVDSRTASEQQLSASSNLMNSLAAYAAVAVNNHRQLEATTRRAAQAAEVVHDLRAPISSMVTIARELLLEHPQATGAREIIALGSQAAALAEGLLSQKRAQRPFSAAACLEESCRALMPLARSAGRGIEVQAEPATMIGDPEDLRRVIINLVTNSLRHGGGTIEVGLRAADEVVLTIRDHGGGIPEHILPEIFTAGVSAGGEGSHGLGMAIVHRLVASSGGRIEAANHPGGGALFTATWARAEERQAG